MSIGWKNLVCVLLLALWPLGAAADVIDGDWCYSDGRHFRIRGPDIVTPAGTATRGAWTRHSFSYVATAAEPNSGATIYMLLSNEETVMLAAGAEPSGSSPQTQVWKRCAPEVSERRMPADRRRDAC